jgi:hypothetical protein
VNSSVADARHLSREVSKAPTPRHRIVGSESRELLSSVSCRGLGRGAVLAGTVHSLPTWKEARYLEAAPLLARRGHVYFDGYTGAIAADSASAAIPAPWPLRDLLQQPLVAPRRRR